MPNPTILTYAGWEQDVRTIMGLDSADVTDNQLHSITLLGQAEQYVKRAVPKWAELTDDSKTLLQLATLYMIAHSLRENTTLMLPQTIKDGENYISWGNRSRISNEEKNLFYDKAWECIELITGIRNDRKFIGRSVPKLNLITGV